MAQQAHIRISQGRMHFLDTDTDIESRWSDAEQSLSRWTR